MINRTVLHRPLSETIGVHSWDNDWIAYNKTHDFSGYKLMHEIGIKYVRIGARLKMMEPSADRVYDFRIWEDYIVGCKKYNLQPIIYMGASVPDWRGNMAYQDALKLNYVLVTEFIKHFANQGIIWEANNEPDHPESWFGQKSYVDNGTTAKTADLNRNIIKDWVDFNRYTFQMIQKYDPKATFLNGPTFTGLQGTVDHYYAWGPMLDYAGSVGNFGFGDYRSMHPYVEQKNPEVWLNNGGSPRSQFYEMQDLLDKYGDSSPQVVTEYGYKTDLWGENGQANLIARSIFVLDMLNVPIDVIFNFAVANGYEDWGIVGSPASDFAERPSAKLVANLLKTLKGTTLVHYDIKDNSSYALFYQGLSGKYIVYWTTATAHDDSYNGTKLHLTNTPQIIKLSDIWQMYDNYDVVTAIVHDANETASLVQGALTDTINRLVGWVEPIKLQDLPAVSTTDLNRNAYRQIHELITKIEDQFNFVVEYLLQNNVHGKVTYVTPEKVKLMVPEGLSINNSYINVLKSNNCELTEKISLLQQVLNENGLLP